MLHTSRYSLPTMRTHPSQLPIRAIITASSNTNKCFQRTLPSSTHGARKFVQNSCSTVTLTSLLESSTKPDSIAFSSRTSTHFTTQHPQQAPHTTFSLTSTPSSPHITSIRDSLVLGKKSRSRTHGELNTSAVAEQWDREDTLHRRPRMRLRDALRFNAIERARVEEGRRRGDVVVLGVNVQGREQEEPGVDVYGIVERRVEEVQRERERRAELARAAERRREKELSKGEELSTEREGRGDDAPADGSDHHHHNERRPWQTAEGRSSNKKQDIRELRESVLGGARERASQSMDEMNRNSENFPEKKEIPDFNLRREKRNSSISSGEIPDRKSSHTSSTRKFHTKGPEIISGKAKNSQLHWILSAGPPHAPRLSISHYTKKPIIVRGSGSSTRAANSNSSTSSSSSSSPSTSSRRPGSVSVAVPIPVLLRGDVLQQILRAANEGHEVAMRRSLGGREARPSTLSEEGNQEVSRAVGDNEPQSRVWQAGRATEGEGGTQQRDWVAEHKAQQATGREQRQQKEGLSAAEYARVVHDRDVLRRILNSHAQHNLNAHYEQAGQQRARVDGNEDLRNGAQTDREGKESREAGPGRESGRAPESGRGGGRVFRGDLIDFIRIMAEAEAEAELERRGRAEVEAELARRARSEARERGASARAEPYASIDRVRGSEGSRDAYAAEGERAGSSESMSTTRGGGGGAAGFTIRDMHDLIRAMSVATHQRTHLQPAQAQTQAHANTQAQVQQRTQAYQQSEMQGRNTQREVDAEEEEVDVWRRYDDVPVAYHVPAQLQHTGAKARGWAGAESREAMGEDEEEVDIWRRYDDVPVAYHVPSQLQQLQRQRGQERMAYMEGREEEEEEVDVWRRYDDVPVAYHTGHAYMHAPTHIHARVQADNPAFSPVPAVNLASGTVSSSRASRPVQARSSAASTAIFTASTTPHSRPTQQTDRYTPASTFPSPVAYAARAEAYSNPTTTSTFTSALTSSSPHTATSTLAHSTPRTLRSSSYTRAAPLYGSTSTSASTFGARERSPGRVADMRVVETGVPEDEGMGVDVWRRYDDVPVAYHIPTQLRHPRVRVVTETARKSDAETDAEADEEAGIMLGLDGFGGAGMSADEDVNVWRRYDDVPVTYHVPEQLMRTRDEEEEEEVDVWRRYDDVPVAYHVPAQSQHQTRDQDTMRKFDVGVTSPRKAEFGVSDAGKSRKAEAGSEEEGEGVVLVEVAPGLSVAAVVPTHTQTHTHTTPSDMARQDTTPHAAGATNRTAGAGVGSGAGGVSDGGAWGNGGMFGRGMVKNAWGHRIRDAEQERQHGGMQSMEGQGRDREADGTGAAGKSAGVSAGDGTDGRGVRRSVVYDNLPYMDTSNGMYSDLEAQRRRVEAGELEKERNSQREGQGIAGSREKGRGMWGWRGRERDGINAIWRGGDGRGEGHVRRQIREEEEKNRSAVFSEGANMEMRNSEVSGKPDRGNADDGFYPEFEAIVFLRGDSGERVEERKKEMSRERRAPGKGRGSGSAREREQLREEERARAMASAKEEEGGEKVVGLVWKNEATGGGGAWSPQEGDGRLGEKRGASRGGAERRAGVDSVDIWGAREVEAVDVAWIELDADADEDVLRRVAAGGRAGVREGGGDDAKGRANGSVNDTARNPQRVGDRNVQPNSPASGRAGWRPNGSGSGGVGTGARGSGRSNEVGSRAGVRGGSGVGAGGRASPSRTASTATSSSVSSSTSVSTSTATSTSSSSSSSAPEPSSTSVATASSSSSFVTVSSMATSPSFSSNTATTAISTAASTSATAATTSTAASIRSRLTMRNTTALSSASPSSSPSFSLAASPSLRPARLALLYVRARQRLERLEMLSKQAELVAEAAAKASVVMEKRRAGPRAGEGVVFQRRPREEGARGGSNVVITSASGTVLQRWSAAGGMAKRLPARERSEGGEAISSVGKSMASRDSNRSGGGGTGHGINMPGHSASIDGSVTNGPSTTRGNSEDIRDGGDGAGAGLVGGVMWGKGRKEREDVSGWGVDEVIATAEADAEIDGAATTETAREAMTRAGVRMNVRKDMQTNAHISSPSHARAGANTGRGSGGRGVGLRNDIGGLGGHGSGKVHGGGIGGGGVGANGVLGAGWGRGRSQSRRGGSTAGAGMSGSGGLCARWRGYHSMYTHILAYTTHTTHNRPTTSPTLACTQSSRAHTATPLIRSLAARMFATHRRLSSTPQPAHTLADTSPRSSTLTAASAAAGARAGHDGGDSAFIASDLADGSASAFGVDIRVNSGMGMDVYVHEDVRVGTVPSPAPHSALLPTLVSLYRRAPLGYSSHTHNSNLSGTSTNANTAMSLNTSHFTLTHDTRAAVAPTHAPVFPLDRRSHAMPTRTTSPLAHPTSSCSSATASASPSLPAVSAASYTAYLHDALRLPPRLHSTAVTPSALIRAVLQGNVKTVWLQWTDIRGRALGKQMAALPLVEGWLSKAYRELTTQQPQQPQHGMHQPFVAQQLRDTFTGSSPRLTPDTPVSLWPSRELARVLWAMDTAWARKVKATEEAEAHLPTSTHTSLGTSTFASKHTSLHTAAGTRASAITTANAGVGGAATAVVFGRGVASEGVLPVGWLPRVETHACRYLWECDEDMEPREGFPGGGWGSGQGDVSLLGDWTSLRWVPALTYTQAHTSSHAHAYTQTQASVAASALKLYTPSHGAGAIAEGEGGVSGLDGYLWRGGACPAGVDSVVMMCTITPHTHAHTQAPAHHTHAPQSTSTFIHYGLSDSDAEALSVRPSDIANHTGNNAEHSAGVRTITHSGHANTYGVDTPVSLHEGHNRTNVADTYTAVAEDVHTGDAHADYDDRVNVQPRDLLQRVLQRARERWGVSVGAAGELEFYLYERSAHTPSALSSTSASKSTTTSTSSASTLSPLPPFPCDYHLLPHTSQLYADAMAVLAAAGVHVEGCKGEAGAGQHELNVRWRRGVAAADDLLTAKRTLEHWAHARGLAVSFHAKPHATQPGSGLHMHVHIDVAVTTPGDDHNTVSTYGDNNTTVWKNAFADGKDGDIASDMLKQRGLPLLLSPLEHFVAGVLWRMHDLSPLLLPHKDSYQRVQSKTWGPSHPCWGIDNRTVAVRVVGEGKGRRVEVRVAGADVQPHLLLAAIVASGMDGLERSLLPPPPVTGNAYDTATDSTYNAHTQDVRTPSVLASPPAFTNAPHTRDAQIHVSPVAREHVEMRSVNDDAGADAGVYDADVLVRHITNMSPTNPHQDPPTQVHTRSLTATSVITATPDLASSSVCVPASLPAAASVSRYSPLSPPPYPPSLAAAASALRASAWAREWMGKQTWEHYCHFYALEAADANNTTDAAVIADVRLGISANASESIATSSGLPTNSSLYAKAMRVRLTRRKKTLKTTL